MQAINLGHINIPYLTEKGKSKVGSSKEKILILIHPNERIDYYHRRFHKGEGYIVSKNRSSIRGHVFDRVIITDRAFDRYMNLESDSQFIAKMKSICSDKAIQKLREGILIPQRS